MSTWVLASLLSAFFLGVYQLCTKHAVHGNAVLPVLFLSNLTGAGVWLLLLAAERFAPGALPDALVTAAITPREHLLILAKSLVVAGSWLCGYFAVKHLPVSIAAPIRATGPVWTLAGAIVLLGERPGWVEFVGMSITLAGFFWLSVAGRAEGIHFSRNRWIGWLIAATLLGAVSGLYDKVLLGPRVGLAVPTLQCWFSIYLAVLFTPFAMGWRLRGEGGFQWRWSVPAIALTLLVADYIYFAALRDPDALVSIVSSLRRGSTLVAFAGGVVLYGEKNPWKKLPAVLGILAGIALTVSATR